MSASASTTTYAIVNRLRPILFGQIQAVISDLEQFAQVSAMDRVLPLKQTNIIQARVKYIDEVGQLTSQVPLFDGIG